ncbi:hypothetical protein OG389_34770 [Streptomyces sp. NBC_00435]|uniref:hypothetical protein n=1 Tax=Streptomyces sp. NBC_00435 TaxID=2903649 RepID=UPI002E1FD52D
MRHTGDKGKGSASVPGARHLAPCVIALLASLLCGACGGNPGNPAGPAGGGAAGTSPPPVPEPLDRIAAALGCSPEVTVDAQEVREGACTVGTEAFRLATFSTTEGRGAWLAESRQYGGTYLVGDRWIVTAPSPGSLAPAQSLLGGTLDSPPSHSHEGHPAAGGAPEHPA